MRKRNKINNNNNKLKDKPKLKTLGEGSKLLLQLRAHGNGNKPLLPPHICKGWATRDSHLLVAFHIARSLFVAHVLPFHSCTYTLNSKHTLTNTKERKKEKTKRSQKHQKTRHKTNK
jgi:hypothetical protein